MKPEKPTAAEADQDSEGGQSPVIEAFDQLADSEFQLQTGQLVCDLRDVMLQIIKQLPKPWQQLKEDEQRDIAAGVERAAESMVKTTCVLISAKGQNVITASFEKFTFKSGSAQIVLKAAGHAELAHDLADFDGQAVLLVSADAAPFYGMTQADIDRDAPELFHEEEPQPPAVALDDE
jgi:hypothetical protein